MPPAKHHIELSKGMHTFFESRRLCENSSPVARLALPTDAASNLRLQNLLKASKQTNVWLGIGDFGKEGDWSHLDGAKANYTNWAAGQPDDGNGPMGEDCAEMWSTGEWNDTPCGAKRIYACVVSGGAATKDHTPAPKQIDVTYPTLTLRNGVKMPRLLLGAGGSTWMNDQKTENMVHNALLAGFPGIDTANHYRNHWGIARGIQRSRQDGYQGQLWLQTKIEGCGNSVDPRSTIVRGSCHQGTIEVFHKDLKALGVAQIDMALLHAPPCVPGAPWVEWCGGPDQQDKVYPHNMDCTQAEPCEMIQEQWLALESLYKEGKARSIGVSNYCKACIRCIEKVATVMPHANQLYFHAGMGGPDPNGLISSLEPDGIKVQAYRPLAQGRLLRDPTVHQIAQKHGKSASQVALKWVIHLGHTVITTTENPAHMRDNMDIYDWELDAGDVQRLNQIGAPEGWMDNIVGGNCRLDV